jgi:serine/threonine protein kinase/FixJ family two-component response regulator
MKPEVLLVDDAEEFRQLAAQFLAIEWPDVEVDEWDPSARGHIPDFYPLGGYDALLLDCKLGLGHGLDWLARLVRREDCPPVVLLVDHEDANVTAEAMQRGAFDYLRKGDLSKERLVDAIRAAAAARAARALSRSTQRSNAGSDSEKTAVLKGDVSTGVPAHEPPEVVINGYRMLEKIGSGGMSTVYLAERAADGLRLVMKIMNARLADDKEFLLRFIQEYGLVSKIDCPHVVRIYDQGVTDRHVYIAMEHFAAGDLRARIRKGLAPAEAFDVLQDVGRALIAVHGHGIVHRDLKPENVMFRADGSLAIVDFGIATKSAGADLTAHGDVLGTPHYVSPEQACARPLDRRSDLYSLGIVYFEMLTGRRPFRAKDAVALAHKHVNEPLPRLPAELACYQEVVDCLTAKRPEDRFSGARELLTYLEANAATLRRGAQAFALIDEERPGSLAPDVHGGSVPAPRSSSNVATHTSAKSRHDGTRTEIHKQPNVTDRLLNGQATLERLGGDAARVGDVARSVTRIATPLLTLFAEALHDSNLHFVYEAARLLKGAVGAVEAPEVSKSIVELERHAKKHDAGATAAAFLVTHGLLRRLMSELSEISTA